MRDVSCAVIVFAFVFPFIVIFIVMFIVMFIVIFIVVVVVSVSVVVAGEYSRRPWQGFLDSSEETSECGGSRGSICVTPRDQAAST